MNSKISLNSELNIIKKNLAEKYFLHEPLIENEDIDLVKNTKKQRSFTIWYNNKIFEKNLENS